MMSLSNIQSRYLPISNQPIPIVGLVAVGLVSIVAALCYFVVFPLGKKLISLFIGKPVYNEINKIDYFTIKYDREAAIKYLSSLNKIRGENVLNAISSFNNLENQSEIENLLKSFDSNTATDIETVILLRGLFDQNSKEDLELISQALRKNQEDNAL